MTAVTGILDALATQIATRLASITDLQVDGRLIPSPTPPSIDVYPADPFQEALTFGRGNNILFVTVRARVTTVDNEGGQELLLSMMDPVSAVSVAQAVTYDKTLGGAVGKVSVIEGPSGYGVVQDAGGQGALLGCTWRVQVVP